MGLGMLNTKIGCYLGDVNGLKMKMLEDGMTEDGITKTWAKTTKKTRMKRESYVENSFGKNLSDVGYGSGVAYGSVWTQIRIKPIKNRF
ncbi:hypothetical protein Hanom_Chr16g01427081 [Helianthus anomalus]